MAYSDLYSMFMLGLLSTGHCIGMCGPLVFAFPASTGRFLPHVLYHCGRTVTYVMIGFIMGALGGILAGLASLTGADPEIWIINIRIALMLLASLFLAIFGLSRLSLFPEPGWLSIASPEKIPGYKKIIKSALFKKGDFEMLAVGVIMGFLPCGLSFAAFARALPAGGPLKGAALVLAFAVGTIPGLLLLGTGASGIVRRYRRLSDILAGLLMIYMAIKLAWKAVKMLLM